MKNRDGHDPNNRSVFVMNFDGLCEPKNPGGIATYGVVIRQDDHKVFEQSGLADAEPWSNDASNNVAEYSALIRGLEWLKSNCKENDKIIIRGDSSLVVNQLNGKFKVKSHRLVELYFKSKELASHFNNLKIEWVGRSLNSEADLLSRIAYSRYRKKSVSP